MAPYLETVKSFETVTVTEDGVNTLEFLEAANGVVGLFNLFGSVAFTVVQKDLSGNIEKVRNRYNAAPEKSATLEKLVAAEKTEKKTTATEGLLWLLRGLAFTCQSLQKAQADKTKTLTAAFTDGYGDTLKKFHGILIKPVFTLAMNACPSRETLLKSLSEDPNKKVSDEELAKSFPDVEKQLDAWLAALAQILSRLQAFYDSLGDKNFKVL